MTGPQRRWLSVVLGAGLVLLLMVITSFDDRHRLEPQETFELREVRIYEPPPPPPPPPPDFQGSRRAGPAMSLAPHETAIVLDIMELDVKLAVGELGDLGAGGWGIGDGAGAGLEIVSLAELDSAPAVMGSPVLVYPKEAIDLGITEFEVLVHILIDEEGRTYPIRIVDNPFPSFREDLERYVSGVVFSPPTRLGVPVRTEYLWPLLIRQ
jgi:hypothetical protein